VKGWFAILCHNLEVLVMLSKYRELEIVELSQVRRFLQPGTPVLGLDSPATMFMTDFVNTQPIVIDENRGINTALNRMKQSYVRLLLVSAQQDQFRGIITASDIHGGKVLSYMAAVGLRHRDEVMVKNIMTNKDHIHALPFEQLQNACVGDVINTIKHLGEQHILVVEGDENGLMIRGMFSSTNIAKALHISFDVEPHARSFFELEQVILHHDFNQL
jgi:signal-transduction protein with cAMP-binding, CBS, and nucleotidyltransferase domain